MLYDNVNIYMITQRCTKWRYQFNLYRMYQTLRWCNKGGTSTHNHSTFGTCKYLIIFVHYENVNPEMAKLHKWR